MTTTAWQFNEAVSLLREARQHVTDGSDLAAEIDAGLPAIQAALQESAHATERVSTVETILALEEERAGLLRAVARAATDRAELEAEIRNVSGQADRNSERAQLTERHLRRLLTALAQTALARASVAPPSPPPPPDTVPADTYHAALHERDAIREELGRVRAELDLDRAEDVGRPPLYRARARGIAIHSHGHPGLELELDTEDGDRLRLHVTHESGAAIVRAGLNTTPLIVTVTALDLDAAPPSSPAPDDSDERAAWLESER